MGWKFFGPTADSGESAVGVCRGSPTADAIFEFVNGSFVVSFTGGTNQGPAYYQECVSLFGKKVFMKPVNE